MPNIYELLVNAKFDATQLQKELDTASRAVKVKVDVETSGKSAQDMKAFTTETIKATDSVGNFTKTVNTYNKEGELLSQGLTTSSKAVKSLGQDFLETTGKVLKFGASTAVIGLMSGAVAKAWQEIQDFNKAQTEFTKVSDLTGDSLTRYTDRLSDLGTEVGRSKTAMVEASTEFIKAGFTETQSANLAKNATLFQNIADNEVQAGDAANFLTSQIKAFNIPAENSTKIIDSVNEVSNQYAVSSSDLASGLTKTAAAMGTLGNTFDESLALMVGAGEEMPNQSGKIARG